MLPPREAGAGAGGGSRRSVASPDDQSVTFVELFFDLVFVFSITEVVGLLGHGVTWTAAGQAVLAFWLVWWAWTQFTWALNAADTDVPAIQLSTLFATAVAFFMAVGVGDAFEGRALAFAIPYVGVRITGLAIYAWVAADDPAHRRAVRTFALLSAGGLVAVVAGAWLGGTALYAVWAAAIVLDVLAAGVAGRFEGWRLHSAHFVERHGLIVIIALGESLIVAAGSVAGGERDGPLLAVAVLAVAITCAFWWSYFPYVRPRLEEAMEALEGPRRTMMARDTFSLAHFPLLCGVIAFAAAVENAAAHPHDPLALGPRVALGAGLLLFLGGTAVAKWRALGSLSTGRWIVSAVGAAVVAAWAGVPPWASLALALTAVAAVVFLEWRRVRGAAGPPGHTL